MWVPSPLMYVAVVVMFVMTAFSYQVDFTLFIVELSISTVFAISLLFLQTQFWLHLKIIMKSAKSVLTTENEQALNELAMPVLVAGVGGDVVWSNDSFIERVAEGEKVFGENATKFVYPKTLRRIANENGSDIKYKDKHYTVYATKTDECFVLYFIDDTYYKKIHKEYTEKKLVVAVVSFDNKEELIRDISEVEESRINAEVETVLREWAIEMSGFIRKLSGNLYLLITDEISTEKAKAGKFAILDKVRKIKGSRDLSATISVGIGKDASTATESENWARRALEMALGRGGDQVVIIKPNDVFEFFGGISKGYEKRDKVRSRVIANSLSENIKTSEKVFVMGHKFSDLDSMGSAIGIWAVAKKTLKKEVHIVVNKTQSLALALITEMMNEYPNERIFISPQEATQEQTDKTLVVVVDTHSQSFVECPELVRDAGKVVVIDHHRMMVNYIKNSEIFYHEPSVSSASEMVTELIQYMDLKALSATESQALLSGIMLDTKNFVLKTGVRTFEAAAFLKQRGADTIKVKKYFSNTISTYKEKSHFVAAAEVYNGCALACGNSTGNSTRVSAAQAADELLYIQGVKASFVLFKLGNEIVMSGRSLGEVNVQVILEEFGGGGHLTMAGAQVKNLSLEEAKSALLAVIQDKIE